MVERHPDVGGGCIHRRTVPSKTLARSSRTSPASQRHHGGTVGYLRDAVFNYPTLAEAHKVAALDGLNRL